MISIALKAIIDYIFPIRCISCYELNIAEDGLCALCWSKLAFISKPYCQICGSYLEISILEEVTCSKCLINQPIYTSARSIMKFDEYSKILIHAFKYYDKTNLAKIFAKLICHRYENYINNVDLIIPVPMHKLKRLVRMYNHAYLLALAIAKIVNKPVYYDILIKTKWTKSQASLTKAQREKNLTGSFKINSGKLLQNKKILLVDDVKTTGTTISKCTKLLKNYGAKDVYVVTIASTK